MQQPRIDERMELFVHDVVIFVGTVAPVPGTRRVKACTAGAWGQQARCERLLDEANQIARILAAIVISAKHGGSPDSHNR
jgi:hypothetical protein